MTEHPTSTPAGSARVPTSARPTTTMVWAIVALTIAVPQLVAGIALWIATEQDTSDDPLVGLGYMFALFVGVPGALGLLLGIPALVWWRRPAGPVLTVLALVAVALPVITLVMFLLPGPVM